MLSKINLTNEPDMEENSSFYKELSKKKSKENTFSKK